MGNRKPGQNWDRLLAVAGRARSRLEPSSSARNPMVVRHIQALEDEPNSRLFRKTSTGYGLTDAEEGLISGPKRSLRIDLRLWRQHG